MGKAESSMIENENLFRSLVCIPPAIIFVLLAVNSISTSGIVIFQIIFTLIASYFTLATVGYAALYTNERYEGKTEPLFKNTNLSKAVKFLPLAIIFIATAVTSISSSAHVVFNVISILLASYTVLATLGYAAFYTNDYFEEHAH